MSADDSTYKVGPGKPPLHTRFQKGQSGNPSGKPGPAKLARQRFQRALCAALEAETAELKDARPRVTLEGVARRLMLDAVEGSTQAMKLILSELDRETARDELPRPVQGAAGEQAASGATAETGQESAEQGRDEPPPMLDYALWRKANPG